MRMPPLPADSIHARACKLKCEKILTRPHEISQERYIITAIKEALGKSVTKGMRIHNSRVDTVLHCQLFQLPRDTTGGNAFPIFVQKNEATFLLLISQPRKGFIL